MKIYNTLFPSTHHVLSPIVLRLFQPSLQRLKAHSIGDIICEDTALCVSVELVSYLKTHTEFATIQLAVTLLRISLCKRFFCEDFFSKRKDTGSVRSSVLSVKRAHYEQIATQHIVDVPMPRTLVLQLMNNTCQYLSILHCLITTSVGPNRWLKVDNVANVTPCPMPHGP